MTAYLASPSDTETRSVRVVMLIVMILLASGACGGSDPARDAPQSATGAADPGETAREGRILADDTIIADTFEVRHHLRGDTLTMVLETDLPDATLLDVHITRTYRRKGSTEDFPLDYLNRQSTVGAWRRPQTIRIDNAAWRADLEEAATAGGFEVSGIGQDVDVLVMVPINQAAPFREGNQNLRGKAVSPSTWGQIVRRELRIPAPVDDAALPSRPGG